MSKTGKIAWRLICASFLICLVALHICVWRNYMGAFSLVRSTRGVHTEEYAVQQLDKAVNYDQTQGYAYILLAKNFIQRSDAEKALELQELGMRSFLSVRTYAQLGLIYELLGRSTDAREMYTKALRMNSKNVDVLQRLAVLAYDAGDSATLRDYADQIHNLDMNNVNATYLLAKDMERRNDREGALRNYIGISTVMSRIKTLGSKPVFTDEDIQDSIRRLIEALKTP